jgi:DNA-binding NtrC family response regulator
MERASSHPILVVSPRWQTRALLAAQIGEATERDIIPAPGVNEALGLIKLGGIDPVLLVVDASEEVGREGVERLLEAKRETPVVLIASGLRGDALDSLRDRCVAFLQRPVSIGRVAQTVMQILQERQ